MPDLYVKVASRVFSSDLPPHWRARNIVSDIVGVFGLRRRGTTNTKPIGITFHTTSCLCFVFVFPSRLSKNQSGHNLDMPK